MSGRHLENEVAPSGFADTPYVKKSKFNFDENKTESLSDSLKKMEFDSAKKPRSGTLNSSPGLDTSMASTEFSIQSGLQTPTIFKSNAVETCSMDSHGSGGSPQGKLDFKDLATPRNLDKSPSFELFGFSKSGFKSPESHFSDSAPSTAFPSTRKIRHIGSDSSFTNQTRSIVTPSTGKRRVNAKPVLSSDVIDPERKKLSFGSGLETPTSRKQFEPTTASKYRVRRRNMKLLNDEVLLDLSGGRIDFNSLVCLAEAGTGEFSRVFVMQDPVSRTKYALKQHSSMVNSISARDLLLDEMEIFAYIKQQAEEKHLLGLESFVSYFLAWQNDAQLNFLLEHCALGTLDEITIRQQDEGVIFHILLSLCNGLILLHSLNLVHLDIKPDNILITNDGRIKIGDLGMCNGVMNPNLRKEIEGDVRYVSPEVVLNFEISQISTTGLTTMSDMFSLGLSVLKLAIGHDLPKGDDLWKELRSGLPLKPHWGVHGPLLEIINSLIVRTPEKRPSALILQNRVKNISSCGVYGGASAWNLIWQRDYINPRR